MSCAQKHGPSLAGLTAAVEFVKNCGDERFIENSQQCKNTLEGRTTQQAIDTVDKGALCQVMCCCRKVVSGGRKARQECVKQTLDFADRATGFQSRYKAEISYNMLVEPPAPLMHRVDGKDSTERSHHWQTRAGQITGYEQGKGHVRRPDVVIVKDPKKPPTQDNISRVVEMKFKGDVEGDGQMDAYQRIAGENAEAEVLEESECGCDKRKQPEPEPQVVAVPAEEPQKQQSNDWATAQAIGWTVATVVAGVATAAAVLSPFDGPAMDAAGAVATKEAAKKMAASWALIFAPVTATSSGSQ